MAKPMTKDNIKPLSKDENEKPLSNDEIMSFRDVMCAPWANQLDFEIDTIGEKEVTFIWHAGDDVCRVLIGGDKIVSGVAIMALADNASFLTVCALNNALRDCTTVDMGTNFMRPLFAGDIKVVMTALSMGRKLMTLRAEFMQNGKLGATSTSVFVYL
jgi:acyl-coenzyme A thioesterase PaaI-like protein